MIFAVVLTNLFSLPTCHVRTFGNPLVSFFKALGVPLASFLNVQGNATDLYSLFSLPKGQMV